MTDVTWSRFVGLFLVCKENTVGCIAALFRMWLQAINTVSSVFRMSGKENGPGGAGFGEL